MQPRLTMVYWQGERFLLGKLLEHPEIMTQAKLSKSSKKILETPTWQLCLKTYRPTIEQKKLLCEAYRAYSAA